jgi:NADH:ubiquinone oxidoreductase subunit 2 (subunit N)
MNYFELLRLAAPEAVLVFTALVVLALGLSTERASVLCSGVAAAGLLFASAAVLMLPSQAALFNGMLVITPLIALFNVICSSPPSASCCSSAAKSCSSFSLGSS